jgi:hypothetical protein
VHALHKQRQVKDAQQSDLQQHGHIGKVRRRQGLLRPVCVCGGGGWGGGEWRVASRALGGEGIEGSWVFSMWKCWPKQFDLIKEGSMQCSAPHPMPPLPSPPCGTGRSIPAAAFSPGWPAGCSPRRVAPAARLCGRREAAQGG